MAGNDWTGSKEKAGHPNALRQSMRNNPVLTRMVEDGDGRPHQVRLFSVGRRQRYHAARCQASIGNTATRWLIDHWHGKRPRRGRRGWESPARFRGRCCLFRGYNIGNYFQHWLETGANG